MATLSATAIQEESAVDVRAVNECTIFGAIVKSVEWIVPAISFAVEPDSGERLACHHPTLLP